MTLRVLRYASDHRAAWNDFLPLTKNGTFLFHRDYMDYHADRFQDFSAIVTLDEQIVALLPANFRAEERIAVSHAGLTFGGVVWRRDVRGPQTIEIVDRCLDALRAWGARELIVKLVPSFLTSYPAEEAHYALWRRGFVVESRLASSILPLDERLPPNSLRKRSVAKARKAGVTIDAAPNLSAFHEILRAVLAGRHGATPVHTISEIEQLMAAFPDSIRLVTASREGETLAGSLVFDFGRAFHTQYLASSAAGREVAALDLVIDAVIDAATRAGKAHVSFGTSTEDGGRVLNEGLIGQKEGFGARMIVLETMRGGL